LGTIVDTSGEYAAMCDCSEIQDGHDWINGDYFTAECTTWVIGNAGFVYETGIDIYKRSDIPIPSKIASEYGWGCYEKLVWLPRLDQILEMCTIGADEDYYLNDLWDTINMVMLKEVRISHEQTVLKYYMNRYHDKIWDIDKYIPVEEDLKK
jgi:hypothetical protein